MYKKHLEILERDVASAIESVGLNQLGNQLFNSYFSLYPETREYFKETDLDYFAGKKFKIISDFLIGTLKYPDYTDTEIHNEVIRHQGYGLTDREYYFTLIDTYMNVVKQSLQKHKQWVEADEEYWLDATAGMKGTLSDAAKIYIS